MKKKLVKSILTVVLTLFLCMSGMGIGVLLKGEAAGVDGYQSLDKSNPIEFGGSYIKYKNETITLGEKAIYIDGSLSDAVADKYNYVYNDFKEAMAAVKSGTEAEPMKVYIAPYVYWIDDPDDEEIRVADSGDIPYGMIIKCNYLSLIGLTDDPYNVVLAVNRGQTQGAKGNYTMFYFDGTGTRTENLTMGNYCNADLEYPLKPELSRTKRAEAITQAQLALTNGDKIVAINCNFISRLNACPFVGTDGRILFKDCHLECTDDALPGTAVFLNCDFGFYSSKPFYNTIGTGAVFLNCVFNSEVKGTQYLTKAGGTVALIDCEFKSGYEGFKVEWTPEPDTMLKCNQANVTLNGQPLTVAEDNPYNTVDITGTEALKAYKLEVNGKTVYNTYNLLQGSDGWDPLNNKAEIEAVNSMYTHYPVAMTLSPLKTTVKTGESGKITNGFVYFRNLSGDGVVEKLTWEVEDSIKDNVSITINDDGSCSYTVVNTGKKSVAGMIFAKGEKGYKTGTYITVTPETLEAPEFAVKPELTIGASDNFDTDVVKVNYALDTDGKDISLINWYRSSDAEGTDKILTAVTRLDEPEYEYKLTPGDVGYYIIAEVTPKEEGSKLGKAVTAVTDRIIEKEDNLCMEISTDFQNFPAAAQNEIIGGFFTAGGYKPLDTAEYNWSATTGPAWTYGTGEGGATGTGLLQSVRGARLLYTPVSGTYGDMSVRLVVDPCKSAGQGFGSATAQYMDIFIKYDTRTLTGYGVRIERTSKYSNGVDFKLMKYENDESTAISEAVSASCYNATCTITLEAVGNKLTLHVETTHEQSEEQKAAGLLHVVDLSADIETNQFGGSGIMHTGTVGANATMLHQMDIKWNESQMELKYGDSIPKKDDKEDDGKEVNDEPVNSDEQVSEGNDKLVIIITIVAVAAMAVAAVAAVVIKKKRG